ncbi:MAG: prepilin-type N-terminal cleavage/methylation domain-containing protein [Candidatus Omnitrophota bacterium]
MERYKKAPATAYLPPVIPACCKRESRGFTLMELLICSAILVILMALITVLYSRAVKIQRLTMRNRNVQEVVATQMIDTFLNGGKTLSDGLTYATRIEAIDETNGDSPLYVTFANYSDIVNNSYVRIEIGTENSVTTDTTLYQKTALISGEWPPGSWTTTKNLDQNDKINLESGSWFGCYDLEDKNIFDVSAYNTTEKRRAATSKVEICLKAKDKSMPEGIAFILRRIITIRNIYHID